MQPFIEIDKFIRYVPLILVLLINITLYIFFKTLFNEQNAQIATIIAILSNIYIHFHFAPATLGIFFILLIFWSINKEIRKNLIIIIIVGSAILLINIPSYIIIILTSLFLFLIGVIKKEKPKIDVICILILTLLGILYLSHNNYFSNLVLKGIIEKILQKGIQEANFGLITINRYIRICILSIMVFISLYVIYKILKEKTGPNMFLTMLLTKWDIKNQKFSYVVAGHDPVILYKAKEKKVYQLKEGGMALGMVADLSKLLKSEDVELEEGDMVVIYTDGIPEAWANDKENYGLGRLKRAVSEFSSLKSAEDIKNAILKDVKSFMGDYEQKDDITLMVFKRT